MFGSGQISDQRGHSPASVSGFSESALAVSWLRASALAEPLHGTDPYSRVFHSLAQETDPQIFFSDLLTLGREAMKQDQAPLAGRIFGALTAPESAGPWQVPPEIRREAESLKAAMSGGGPLGQRLEILLPQVVEEVFHPSTLVGMGVASWVGMGAKAYYLRSMAGRPLSWWTRLASRAPGIIAEARALPWEVSAFWAAHRGVEFFQHPDRLSWNPSDLMREWASLGVGLGFLKLGAWTGRALPLAPRWAADSMGTYGGILLGQGVQQRLSGANPFPRTGSAAGDALVMWAQFYLSGKVVENLAGPAHGLRMARLEGEIRSLESGPWFSSQWHQGLAQFFSPQWAWAGTGGGLRPAAWSGRGESGEHILWMSGNQEGGGSGPRPGKGRAFSASSRPLPPSLKRPNPTLQVRPALEQQIAASMPGYARQLEKLLSETQLREILGEVSDAASGTAVPPVPGIAERIRAHWGEEGIPRLELTDPLVQQSVARAWINSQRGASEPGPILMKTLAEIHQARTWLESFVFADGSRYQRSNLTYSPELSRALGRRLFTFSDLNRRTGSFKERGALVEVARAAQTGVTHVVTASHGNHGLAVALAAKNLNLRATIVVPHTTPQIKIDQLRALEATVVITGKQPERGYEEARDWGLQYVLERNEFLRDRLGLDYDPLRYIHGFEQVIPGQGVAGWEISEGVHHLSEPYFRYFEEGRPTFLLPLGGGGLAAGAGAILRQRFPKSLIVGVLSEQAPSMHVSLSMGRRYEVLVNPESLFDSGIGLAIPGQRPFEILQEVLDGTVTVNEAQGGEAIRLLHHHTGQVVEGGGAAGVAALVGNRLEPFGVKPKDPVVTLLTGRNIDRSRLDGILSGAEAPLPGGILDRPAAPSPRTH